MRLLPGNPMRAVLMAVLCFEVVAFGLAIPVMIFVSGRSGLLAGLSGGAAAVLALLAAGLLRRPLGWPLAWLTQVAGLALGLATPGMFIVGSLFAALWVLTFVLGRKLEANRGDAGTGGGQPAVPGR
jgi:hypothetical protein